jgi:DNA-directed RNA polymerase specialized sigma24 family protein
VGERAGFEEFVATNERPLRQALTAACGIDHGREVAADALAYAWEHWERVGAMANPVGYLFVVGRNRHRRQSQVRRSVPVSDLGVDRSEPWCEPALGAELARLSERDRTVVLLANGFEWTLAEIAGLLGVSKSTVQTHAERGMAKLRAGLGVTS